MEKEHAMNGCEHAGYYSGMGVYARESQTLRYVLICDECGEEMKEILEQDYSPDPVFQPAA